MGIFFEKFCRENPNEIHIIQLDNATIHTAKKLKVPNNIILLFQPPTCGQVLCCPEINPIERLWEYVKYRLRSLWFTDLDDVKDKVAQIFNSLSTDIIIS